MNNLQLCSNFKNQSSLSVFELFFPTFPLFFSPKYFLQYCCIFSVILPSVLFVYSSFCLSRIHRGKSSSSILEYLHTTVTDEGNKIIIGRYGSTEKIP